ncbi:MAG: hypothetical protein QOD67_2522 [Caballeronia sp.]|nr:hypothetical protein [Caballeronia sp.]
MPFWQHEIGKLVRAWNGRCSNELARALARAGRNVFRSVRPTDLLFYNCADMANDARLNTPKACGAICKVPPHIYTTPENPRSKVVSGVRWPTKILDFPAYVLSIAFN